jgi:hypothetical protein
MEIPEHAHVGWSGLAERLRNLNDSARSLPRLARRPQMSLNIRGNLLNFCVTPECVRQQHELCRLRSHRHLEAGEFRFIQSLRNAEGDGVETGFCLVWGSSSAPIV